MSELLEVSEVPHYSVIAFATNGQAYGYLELVCDTKNDVAYLPTAKNEIAVGSKCTCIETGKVYMLSNAREWIVFGSGNEDEEGFEPGDQGGSEEPGKA